MTLLGVQNGETVGRVSWGSGGVHEGSGTETSEGRRISWEAGVNADSQARPRGVESAGLKGKGHFGDSAVGGAVKHYGVSW